MYLDFQFNMSKKRRGVRTGESLSKDNLDQLLEMKLTKGNLLGVTNSFGDFLGIAEPFTIRFRLKMKDLFDRDVPLGWDDPITYEEKTDWINLIIEAVETGNLEFPRRCRPHNAIGGPMVVGFGDGAFPAFCGVVYLVWEYMCDGSITCPGCTVYGGAHLQSSFQVSSHTTKRLHCSTV